MCFGIGVSRIIADRVRHLAIIVLKNSRYHPSDWSRFLSFELLTSVCFNHRPRDIIRVAEVSYNAVIVSSRILLFELKFLLTARQLSYLSPLVIEATILLYCGTAGYHIRLLTA